MTDDKLKAIRKAILANAAKLLATVGLAFLCLRVLVPHLVDDHDDVELALAAAVTALAVVFAFYFAFSLFIDIRRISGVISNKE